MVTRANTWQDAYATGTAKLDLGDGIVIPLPIDGTFPGEPGPPGAGVPVGGAALQVVRMSAAGTTTEWVSPSKSMVGLGNTDNTPDVDKPISTPTQAALDAKAGVGELNAKANAFEVDQALAGKLASADAATVYATKTEVTDELAAQVNPLVADAIAANPTVANAAAAAVNASPAIATLTAKNTAQDGRLDTAEIKIAEPQQNIKIVSKMVAGHGWTNGPTTYAAFNLNDTTDKAVGDRAVTITTDGTGQSGYVQKIGLNIDLTRSGLVFWVKATNIGSIKSVALNIANNDTFTTGWFGSLPIAAGKKSPLADGEWFPVYFSMGNAGVNNGTPNRTSITALRLTLTDWSGYPQPTLKIGGVGTFIDKAPRYPKGVISLTFDDTWAEHATVAAPKMAEYGFPGTEYVIPSRLGTAGYLTMDQLHQLQEVYGWEIGAHASNDAAHVDWTLQTTAWVEAELAAQKQWQADNGFPTDSFAYPIGPFNSDIARRTKRYYESSRSTYPWRNSAAHPHRHRISCDVVTAAVSLAAAKIWVDRAVANGGWPVFLFHTLVASGATGNDWLISDFNALIDYIAASGLPVATVGDVIKSAN